MSIVGGHVPKDRPIDGLDISSELFNWFPDPQPEPVTIKKLYKKVDVPHRKPRMLVFYCRENLMAVRYGSYKFHFITQKPLTKEEIHMEPGQCGDGGFPLQYNRNCAQCITPPECITQYPESSPLMYNIDEDPNEAYPLNVTLSKHKAILDEMLPRLEEFKAKMVIAPPLLDYRSDDVIPCCTPNTWPNCTCNYKYEGPIPKPGRGGRPTWYSPDPDYDCSLGFD